MNKRFEEWMAEEGGLHIPPDIRPYAEICFAAAEKLTARECVRIAERKYCELTVQGECDGAMAVEVAIRDAFEEHFEG